MYKGAQQQYVRVDVFSDEAFDWMPYYTHHKHMDAHHYVCVDVLSDCSFDWTTYYTLYKYKDTHHYGCVDVLSDSSYDCMPCYTFHMHMDAQPHHRNICIQHCVYEVVHLEFPGKNTKVKH